MSNNIEVNYDDLEYLPEGLYLYKKVPYTGTITEYYPTGEKWSEIHFKDGLEHGWWRSWHRNGQIEGETPWVDGARHGTSREFFENGSLKEEDVFEFGVLLSKQVGNESGEIVERYERTVSDVHYQNVLKKREQSRRQG